MRRVLLFVACLAVVVLCCFVRSSASVTLFGTTGHQLTANIAQEFLDSSSTSEVNYLLANVSGQLSAIAVWADQVRNTKQYSWSAPYHYADTPDWACRYVDSDCPSKGCVVTAITNYTGQLDSNEDTQEIAIRFDVHFHGDIHQPLHCGFVSDRGGNDVTGKYFGSSTNLHSLWDDGLIKTRLAEDFDGSQTKYVDYLVSQIKGPWKNDASEWISCPDDEIVCPSVWADESAQLACQYGYTDENGNHIKDGFNLADPYYQFVKDVVDRQLAKGGLRLANTLNRVWNKDKPKNILSRFADRIRKSGVRQILKDRKRLQH